jgi:hypothetical protein
MKYTINKRKRWKATSAGLLLGKYAIASPDPYPAHFHLCQINGQNLFE